MALDIGNPELLIFRDLVSQVCCYPSLLRRLTSSSKWRSSDGDIGAAANAPVAPMSAPNSTPPNAAQAKSKRASNNPGMRPPIVASIAPPKAKPMMIPTKLPFMALRKYCDLGYAKCSTSDALLATDTAAG